MYLIDIKKLYFYAVSFISLIALAFSLLGGLSNLARYYWFKTGPMISYQPPYISNWIPWNSMSAQTYSNPDDPYSLKMEEESTNVAELVKSFSDVDPNIKTSLQSWQDAYATWKSEQVNLKRSIQDNIVLNLTAFFIFLPIFLFHIRKALQMDVSGCACGGNCSGSCGGNCNGSCGDNCNGTCDSDSCACGGNCSCQDTDTKFCSDECECGGVCMCGICETEQCKCECHIN